MACAVCAWRGAAVSVAHPASTCSLRGPYACTAPSMSASVLATTFVAKDELASDLANDVVFDAGTPAPVREPARDFGSLDVSRSPSAAEPATGFGLFSEEDDDDLVERAA